jgi:aerobic-type carbon monoxide dehydrogenase small subunit (CoxS/CutS family)
MPPMCGNVQSEWIWRCRFKPIRTRQEKCIPRLIHFTLNGKAVGLHTDDNRTLLWVLRTDLALTGTKYGCGAGICGACTVLSGGKAIRSCQIALKDVEGKDLVTIEGLAAKNSLHPLQQAFIDHGAFQCGYCTSGMIMTAVDFLENTPSPSPAAIVAHMDQNLCRCGAQQRIVAAIGSAAQVMSRASHGVHL